MDFKPAQQRAFFSPDGRRALRDQAGDGKIILPFRDLAIVAEEASGSMANQPLEDDRVFSVERHDPPLSPLTFGPDVLTGIYHRDKLYPYTLASRPTQHSSWQGRQADDNKGTAH